MINWIVISAVLLCLCASRYTYLAWNREVYPNPVSWFVWGFIGCGLFLTADAAQAKEVYFASIVSAIIPVTVFFILLIRSTDRIYSLSVGERACLVLALLGYGLYFFFRDDPDLAQWPVYWMIGVDAIVVYPTLIGVVTDPFSDKPASWMVFGIGYGVTGLAITEHTIVNWALPIYMFCSSFAIATPMVYARLKNRSPLSQWW